MSIKRIPYLARVIDPKRKVEIRPRSLSLIVFWPKMRSAIRFLQQDPQHAAGSTRRAMGVHAVSVRNDHTFHGVSHNWNILM